MTAFDVAILAGGRGTRLASRAGTLPKPLVPIAGTPALGHQLALCRTHGFRRVLLLVHHEHEQIRAYAGDGAGHGVEVDYQIEDAPRGTAGALRDGLPRLADAFLVLYGDTYVDVDLRRLWDAHRRSGAAVTLFVHPNDHPQDSDLVELDAEARVTAIHPYPRSGDRDLQNLVNAGLCVMERQGLASAIPATGQADLARHTVPALVAAGARVYGYRSPEYIRDFGTPERLDEVEHEVREGLPERLSGRAPRAAVFLDRDGTLNEEVDHLREPDQVALIEGSAAAVRRLNRAGRLAVVITNQPVLARGEVTPEGLARVHARLASLLGRAGAYLDAVYACPHHPDGGFPGEVPALKVDCDCRKPRTGSIDAACRDLLIDRDSSWLVGDTTVDVETGWRAGVKTILVRTGHAGRDGRYPFRPDYVASDLAGAVSWIQEGHPVMCRRMAPVAAAAATARLVLVGGLARTGKSFAAQVLKEAIAASGRRAHILPLDSWLKPRDVRAEGRGVVSRYDTSALLAEVTPMLGSTGRHTLTLPVYDRARRAPYEHRLELTIGPDDLLIVEGVPALLIDDLVDRADVRVHVGMPEPRRLAHLRADYRWRGETDAAVEALIASRAIDESGAVEAARTRADFVLSAWTEP